MKQYFTYFVYFGIPLILLILLVAIYFVTQKTKRNTPSFFSRAVAKSIPAMVITTFFCAKNLYSALVIYLGYILTCYLISSDYGKFVKENWGKTVNARDDEK